MSLLWDASLKWVKKDDFLKVLHENVFFFFFYIIISSNGMIQYTEDLTFMVISYEMFHKFHVT